MSLYTVDKNKRGKLLAVSLLITAIVVLSKLIQQSEVVNVYEVFFSALLVGTFSYIGLLWALGFQTTFRSMIYVISQSSLIVFILTVFLEIFIFRRVGRVYEILILFTVSGFMFFITYGSFLMANIFNVAHFKDLPLIQVAKTTSFLLSLLSIYFITFSVLEMSLINYVTIILLAIMYFLILLFHFRHLGVARNTFWRSFTLTFVSILLVSSMYIFIGGNPLVYSIIPAVVGYSLINLSSLENIDAAHKTEYYLITIIAIILAIFIAI